MPSCKITSNTSSTINENLLTLKEEQKTTTVNGRAISLTDAATCMAIYGFAPKTILRNLERTIVLVGMAKNGGYLCVKDGSDRRHIYRLDNVFSKEDLKAQGYVAEASLSKKRKRDSELENGKKMVAHIGNFFQKQVECDIFLRVGDQQIGGHSLFLSEASDYFRNLLEGRFKGHLQKQDTAYVIPIEECDFEDVKAILAFLYSGHITLTEENILAISALADRFVIDKLKQHCLEFLSEIVEPSQALLYFQGIHGTSSFLNPVIENYCRTHLLTIYSKYPETLEGFSEKELAYLVKTAPDESMTLFQTILTRIMQSEAQAELSPFLYTFLFSLPEKGQNFSTNAHFLSGLLSSSEQQKKFEEMLNNTPSTLLMSILYAFTLTHLGQHKHAQTLFEEILFIDPKNHLALSGYANTWVIQKQFQKAKVKFEEALAGEPQDVWTLIEYAKTLVKLNQWDQAKVLLEKALTIEPKHISALADYIPILIQLNQLDLAEIKCQEALHIESNNFFILANYGKILCLQNLFFKSQETFDYAFDLEPQNPLLLEYYAECLYETNQFEGAKKLFEDVRQLTPQGAFISKVYAQTLCSLNFLDEAKEMFEAVLELTPLDSFTLNGYAETLRQLGLLDQAKVTFEAANKVNSTNTWGLINYADTLQKIAQRDNNRNLADQARAIFEKIKPTLIFGLNSYGETLHYLGLFEKAKTMFEQALQSEPKNISILKNYSQTLFKLDLTNEAMANLIEATLLEFYLE